MRTAIIIPVRTESRRFPNKPLALIDGVPMIKHVYDICAASGIDTYVATTDNEIAALFDFNVIKVNGENGTDRCANAAKKLDYDYFINVQGDFVGVTFPIINAVQHALTENGVTTGHTTYDTHYDMFFDHSIKLKGRHDPNNVHVILRAPWSKEPIDVPISFDAVWFTRSDIQYGHKHYGIYGFSKDTLLKYNDEYIMGVSEFHEKLEQLRWIDMGINVQSVNLAQWIDPLDISDINTPEDLEEWHGKAG